MNRKAFAIAIVVTILGVFLLLLYQRRFEQEASGGDKVKLLIAVKPIERGQVLVDDMLATREVPLAYVEDRAIKEAERAKIVGLRVGNLVQAQQTLMWTDLASNEEQRDLSGLIQAGSRAVSIRTSRDDSNASMIKPGDYVDVISVMPDPSAPPTSDLRLSVVLMQRVLVLASGLNFSADQSDNGNVHINTGDATMLTLSVTLAEAQVLALAAEHGHLAVILRPPGDVRISSTTPDISSRQLLDTKERNNLPIRRPGGPTALGPQEVR
ncbi:MAG TPA: Flp pilus assembly protein CpaB [Polyangiaceae bacterium]|nr:Flp pilus assembly protein CpaB [Polyangiaceae bacterium]